MMLHVTTARGILSWAAWREAYESVARNDGNEGALSLLQGARMLDNLAHIEVASVNGDLKVAVTPAVLAKLPRPGLPRAVLCGGRSPQTERKLRDSAAEGSGRFASTPSWPERQHPPRSFFVEAENDAALARIASAAGVRFADVPPSWLLANGAAGIEDY